MFRDEKFQVVATLSFLFPHFSLHHINMPSSLNDIWSRVNVKFLEESDDATYERIFGITSSSTSFSEQEMYKYWRESGSKSAIAYLQEKGMDLHVHSEAFVATLITTASASPALLFSKWVKSFCDDVEKLVTLIFMDGFTGEGPSLTVSELELIANDFMTRINSDILLMTPSVIKGWWRPRECAVKPATGHLSTAFFKDYDMPALNESVNHLAKYCDNVGLAWDDQYHTPSFLLCNASLTGKSKHVFELSKSRNLIYVCLRKKSDNLGYRGGDSGFPMRSSISDFLLNGTDDTAHEIYANDEIHEMTKRIASVRLEREEENLQQNSSRRGSSEQGWPRHAFIFRFVAFFIACIEAMGKPKDNDWRLEMFANEATFWTPIQARADSLCCTDLNFEKIDCTWGEIKSILRDRISDAISKNLGQNPEHGGSKLIFVFDECRAFIKAKVGNVSSLSLLKTALSCLPQKSRICAVFMDTLTMSIYFVPSADADPSFRSSQGSKLFAPFWQITTWDQWANAADNASSYSARFRKDPLCWKVFKYGRPSWYSHILAGDSVSHVTLLAAQKMVGGYSSLNDKGISDEAHIAIASCRLAISAFPLTSLAHALVGKYCAMPFALSNDCAYIYPAYFSDPVLMEGAAQATKARGWSLIISAIIAYTLQGSIDAGSRGELASLILVLMGMDTALMIRAKDKSDDGIPFSRSVSLFHWLSSTFNGEFIKEMVERWIGRRSKLYQLLSGRLRFNSFQICNRELTLSILKMFHDRGAAISCKPLQKGGADFAIPLMLKQNLSEHEENLIEEADSMEKMLDLLQQQIPFECNDDEYDSMSLVIGCQVKNRKDDRDFRFASGNMTTLAECFKELSPAEGETLPYLSLHLSMRDLKKKSEVIFHDQPLATLRSYSSSRIRQNQPQFCISVSGLLHFNIDNDMVDLITKVLLVNEPLAAMVKYGDSIRPQVEYLQKHCLLNENVEMLEELKCHLK